MGSAGPLLLNLPQTKNIEMKKNLLFLLGIGFGCLVFDVEGCRRVKYLTDPIGHSMNNVH